MFVIISLNNNFWMRPQNTAPPPSVHFQFTPAVISHKNIGSDSPTKSLKPYSVNPDKSNVQQVRISEEIVPNRFNQRANTYFKTSKVESRYNRTTEFTDMKSRARNLSEGENETSFLLEQIDEKDELIKLFKKGQIRNGQPHSDEIINHLNLRLSQKNVLINKINKRLVEVKQTASKQNFALHPFCSESIKIIEEWIQEHERHPAIIRHKLIENIRQSQRHSSSEISTTKEWEKKWEEYQAEIRVLKQRLVFSESEQGKLNKKLQQMANGYKIQSQKLNSTIHNLRSQLLVETENSKRSSFQQVQSLQSENLHYIAQINKYSQQIKGFTSQISNLQTSIKELKLQNNGLKRQERGGNEYEWKMKHDQVWEEMKNKNEEIDYLTNEIKVMKKLQTDYTPIKEKIFMDDESIEKYKWEISSWKQKYESLENQYSELENRYSSSNRDMYKWKNESENSQFQITTLELQINSLNSKIKRLEDAESYEIEEWKIKYEEAISSVRHLKQQLESYRENQYSTGGYDHYKQLYEEEREKKKEVEEQASFNKRLYEQIQNQILQYYRKEKDWLEEKNNLIEQKQPTSDQLKYKVREQIQEQIRGQMTAQFDKQWSMYEKTLLEEYREKLMVQIQRTYQQKTYTREMEFQKLENELRDKIKSETRQRNTPQSSLNIAKQEYDIDTGVYEDLRVMEERIRRQQQEKYQKEFDTRVEEKVYIEIIKNKQSMEVEMFEKIKLEYDEKINESQEKLAKAYKQIEVFIKETQRLSGIITILQEKYKQLLKQQDVYGEESENRQVRILQKRIKEQDQIMVRGQQLLQQAQVYTEKLLKQLEQKKDAYSENENVNRSQQLNRNKKYEEEIQYLTLTIEKLQNINKNLSEKEGRSESYVRVLTIENEELKNSFSRLQKEKMKKDEEWREVLESKSTEQVDRNNWMIEKEEWENQLNLLKEEKVTWELEKSQWRKQKQSYENKLQESYSHLINAQNYIQSSTRESKSIIENLEKQITILSSKQIPSQDDEFRYTIDSRIETLVEKLLEIAELQSSSAKKQAEYLKQYVEKKEEKSQTLRRKLRQSIEMSRGLDRVLILRRSQFKKLNFQNLYEFIQYLDQMRLKGAEINANSSEAILKKLEHVYEA